MKFNKRLAERTLVDVLPGRRARAMGFRLVDELIATACHCLPRGHGKVILPNPDLLGDDDQSLLRVRQRGTRAIAYSVVVAADPCSDLALLGGGTLAGTDLPGRSATAFANLISRLEPAFPELEPSRDVPVFIYTHQDRWIEGVAKSSFIFFGRRTRVVGGTSGAPVFNQDGRVVGIVSFSNANGPDARMCVLADHLPGWVLRKAHEAAGEHAASVRLLSGSKVARRLR